MADTSVKYMSLDLRNPIIVASSPLTASIKNLVKCQEAGAGAVVLKSIFEEQIEDRIDAEVLQNEQYLSHADAASTFEAVTRDYYIGNYVKFLKEAKASLDIPVIASINCSDLSSWLDYLNIFEDAGADAIELNYYPIAADSDTEGKVVDKTAIEFATKVKKAASKPVSVKIGYKYSSLANIIRQMDLAQVDALVLFNRFFRPDIDIKKMTLTQIGNPLSSVDEYSESLRWIALMSQEVKCDLCASTGIHSGETVIKLLLAGAAACQVCSAAIKDIGCIKAMNETLATWMDEQGFASVEDFRGRLAQENLSDGEKWERTQYIRNLLGVDNV